MTFFFLSIAYLLASTIVLIWSAFHKSDSKVWRFVYGFVGGFGLVWILTIIAFFVLFQNVN
jgi:uncharacterized membrane protein